MKIAAMFLTTNPFSISPARYCFLSTETLTLAPCIADAELFDEPIEKPRVAPNAAQNRSAEKNVRRDSVTVQLRNMFKALGGEDGA